jgi:hypothetical protein
MSRKGSPWDDAACELFMKTQRTTAPGVQRFPDASLPVKEFWERVEKRIIQQISTTVWKS